MTTNEAADHTDPASSTPSALIFLFSSLLPCRRDFLHLPTGWRFNHCAAPSSFSPATPLLPALPLLTHGAPFDGDCLQGGWNSREATRWQGHYVSQGAKCPSRHGSMPAGAEKIDGWSLTLTSAVVFMCQQHIS